MSSRAKGQKGRDGDKRAGGAAVQTVCQHGVGSASVLWAANLSAHTCTLRRVEAGEWECASCGTLSPATASTACVSASCGAAKPTEPAQVGRDAVVVTVNTGRVNATTSRVLSGMRPIVVGRVDQSGNFGFAPQRGGPPGSSGWWCGKKGCGVNGEEVYECRWCGSANENIQLLWIQKLGVPKAGRYVELHALLVGRLIADKDATLTSSKALKYARQLVTVTGTHDGIAAAKAVAKDSTLSIARFAAAIVCL